MHFIRETYALFEVSEEVSNDDPRNRLNIAPLLSSSVFMFGFGIKFPVENHLAIVSESRC